MGGAGLGHYVMGLPNVLKCGEWDYEGPLGVVVIALTPNP